MVNFGKSGKNSSWHDNNGIIYSQAPSSEYVSGASSTFFSIFVQYNIFVPFIKWIFDF